jgi:hypothetical protein
MDQQGLEPIGYVYFIRELLESGPGRIRISYSLRDPDWRFCMHNSIAARDIEKFALMRAPYSHEQALHRRFKEYRKRGEWFEACPALLDYIKENAQDWDELLAEELEILEDEGVAKMNIGALVDKAIADSRPKRSSVARRQKAAHPKKRIRRRKPADKPGVGKRFGPLQALLDQLAADKDPTP